MLSRRRFLRDGALAAGGASLLPSFVTPGLGLQEADDPSFDLHAHPGAVFNRGRPAYAGDGAILQTVRAMNEGRLSGAFFGLVADAPFLEITSTGVKVSGSYGPGDPRQLRHSWPAKVVSFSRATRAVSIRCMPMESGRSS